MAESGLIDDNRSQMVTEELARVREQAAAFRDRLRGAIEPEAMDSFETEFGQWMESLGEVLGKRFVQEVAEAYQHLIDRFLSRWGGKLILNGEGQKGYQELLRLIEGARPGDRLRLTAYDVRPNGQVRPLMGLTLEPSTGEEEETSPAQEPIMSEGLSETESEQIDNNLPIYQENQQSIIDENISYNINSEQNPNKALSLEQARAKLAAIVAQWLSVDVMVRDIVTRLVAEPSDDRLSELAHLVAARYRQVGIDEQLAAELKPMISSETFFQRLGEILAEQDIVNVWQVLTDEFGSAVDVDSDQGREIFARVQQARSDYQVASR